MTGSIHTPTRPAVSVDELKRAWHAVQAGQFRRTSESAASTCTPGTATTAATRWASAPDEHVVPLLGAVGAAGVSTVALAIALTAHRPARVVECGPAIASGLASASTAELGTHETGWHQGRRENVLLERTRDLVAGPTETPLPAPAAHPDQLTLLDVGWEPSQVLAGDSWLAAAVADAASLVIVTTATIPGFRRLDALVELLSQRDRFAGDRTYVAVVGPRRRKWPRGLEHCGGSATRRLLEHDRVVEIPHDRELATNGLDSRPLPDALLGAATELLDLIDPTSPGPHDDPDITDADRIAAAQAAVACAPSEAPAEQGRVEHGLSEGSRAWTR